VPERIEHAGKLRLLDPIDRRAGEEVGEIDRPMLPGDVSEIEAVLPTEHHGHIPGPQPPHHQIEVPAQPRLAEAEADVVPPEEHDRDVGPERHGTVHPREPGPCYVA
jgi:hypothetical protein